MRSASSGSGEYHLGVSLSIRTCTKQLRCQKIQLATRPTSRKNFNVATNSETACCVLQWCGWDTVRRKQAKTENSGGSRPTTERKILVQRYTCHNARSFARLALN